MVFSDALDIFLNSVQLDFGLFNCSNFEVHERTANVPDSVAKTSTLIGRTIWYTPNMTATCYLKEEDVIDDFNFTFKPAVNYWGPDLERFVPDIVEVQPAIRKTCLSIVDDLHPSQLNLDEIEFTQPEDLEELCSVTLVDVNQTLESFNDGVKEFVGERPEFISDFVQHLSQRENEITNSDFSFVTNENIQELTNTFNLDNSITVEELYNSLALEFNDNKRLLLDTSFVEQQVDAFNAAFNNLDLLPETLLSAEMISFLKQLESLLDLELGLENEISLEDFLNALEIGGFEFESEEGNFRVEISRVVGSLEATIVGEDSSNSFVTQNVSSRGILDVIVSLQGSRQEKDISANLTLSLSSEWNSKLALGVMKDDEKLGKIDGEKTFAADENEIKSCLGTVIALPVVTQKTDSNFDAKITNYPHPDDWEVLQFTQDVIERYMMVVPGLIENRMQELVDVIPSGVLQDNDDACVQFFQDTPSPTQSTPQPTTEPTVSNSNQSPADGSSSGRDEDMILYIALPVVGVAIVGILIACIIF